MADLVRSEKSAARSGLANGSLSGMELDRPLAHLPRAAPARRPEALPPPALALPVLLAGVWLKLAARFEGGTPSIGKALRSSDAIGPPVTECHGEAPMRRSAEWKLTPDDFPGDRDCLRHARTLGQLLG